MSFTDCHSHLSFLDEQKLQEVFALGHQKNIKSWIMGGYDFKDWNKQIQIKNQHPGVIQTCLGLHPWEVVTLSQKDIDIQLKELEAIFEQADFIGETGLDFFIPEGKAQSKKQCEVFEYHLSLQPSKPYVLHVVQGHGRALEILKNHSARGFVHSFSGSYEVAKQYVDQGFLLSFSSNVCSEKFTKARESLRKIPLESILIESDCPASLESLGDPVKTFFDTAQEVAKLRGLELETLLNQVTVNLESLVGNHDRSRVL